MTNRDRDSVAKLLLAVADRLANAPDLALDQAKRNAETDPYPYQVGALDHACRSEAEALRHLVGEYLVPRPSKVLGQRGKR